MIDTAYVAFINLIVFFAGLVVACAYLGYGLINDYRLYFYLKSRNRKRFDEIYSFSVRRSLLVRVWRYMRSDQDQNDRFVRKCRKNLNECVRYGAAGILLVIASFLFAFFA